MNNLFVPYEIALALKEMGFDEPCIGSYEDNKLSPPSVLHVSYSNQPINTSMWKEEYVETYKKRTKMFEGEEPKNSKMPQWKVAAPLYDQVIDWFIEKHGISMYVSPNWTGSHWNLTTHPVSKQGKELAKKMEDSTFAVEAYEHFTSRKEALNAGILKAIELIKQKK